MDDTGAEVIKATTAGELASRHRAWSGVAEAGGLEHPGVSRRARFQGPGRADQRRPPEQCGQVTRLARSPAVVTGHG